MNDMTNCPSRSFDFVTRSSDDSLLMSLPPLPPPPPPPPPPPLPRGFTPPAALREVIERRSESLKKPKIQYRPPYMNEGEVEDVKKYVPGGYHPVDIGDKIDEFIVVHKLGFGGFATVWLVQSTMNSHYYALKILCAEVPSTHVIEKQVFEYLGDHNQPSIIQLVRSFEITGPNGVHSCLVLPVCGPSLYKWHFGRTFSPGAKFRIAQQVCEGVAFLHQRGVAHTDLTWTNIIFTLPDLQSMSRDAVCTLLGPTETEKLKLRDGSYSVHSPRKIVKNPSFAGFDIKPTNAAVMIIDFGEAFFLDRPCPRRDLGIPIFSFPPEICFGQPPSANSDIWELACLFVETFCERPLFPLIFGGYELLISYIVDYIGILPPSWKGQFRADVYGSWDNGELSSSPDGVWWWFEEIADAEKSDLGTVVGEMASREGLGAEQHEFLTSLLREMLAREPAERIPALAVLRRLNAAAHLFPGEVAERTKVEPARHPDDPPSPPPPKGYDDSDSDGDH